MVTLIKLFPGAKVAKYVPTVTEKFWIAFVYCPMFEAAFLSVVSVLKLAPPDTGRDVLKPSTPKPPGVNTPPDTLPTEPLKLKDIEAA